MTKAAPTRCVPLRHHIGDATGAVQTATAAFAAAAVMAVVVAPGLVHRRRAA